MNKKKKYQEDEDYVPKAFRKEEPKAKRTTRRTKKKKKSKLKIVLSVILILVMFFGVKIGISTHRWKQLATDMVKNENSIVKDANGNVLETIGDSKYKKYVKFESIPKNVKNAYIAIEDERYYSHGGIDLKRTVGAIGSYVIHFGSSSYGGSTITQQLVKNLTGDSTSSITRKVKEWWKACQLETALTKDEVLEAYLNVIYVGPNIYGIEGGANYYFNKSVNQLTLEECAFLAGINNSPNSYNPFADQDNTEKIAKRTKTVLNKMQELGYIDEASCNEAIANVDKGLKFKKGNTQTPDSVYSYHTDALVSEATKDIMKKYNITETFATNYLEMAGLTIYSTENTKIQKETENEFNKSKYSLKSKINNDTSQAAMVIMDHKTGQVLACVGGLGKKKESRSLNRATQSIRQTGSSIKPIAVLLPAIDKKIITASTILDDTEKDFADGYHPTDYNKALGDVTVRRAVESSQNIPFVEIMEDIKPKTAIKYLEKLGVTTLTKEDNNLTLSLGGLEKGISPLEMAGAYATIANDGVYIEPTFYTKIEKGNRTVVKSKQKKKRVVSKEVAYVLKQLLKQPVEGSSGTATYCKIAGVDVAAKTGTTDSNFDRWLCGFTPYYTAVTWFGFDQNERIEFNKKNPAGLIWANVMSRIHTGLKSAAFDKVSSVKTAKICSETGLRATSGCPHTYTEYYLKGTVPKLCTKHKGTELKEDTNDTNTNSFVQNIIEGITNDIDALDPQEAEKANIITNTNTTNSSNTTTNTTNSNTSTNTNTNTTTNTNTNTTNTNSTINSNSTTNTSTTVNNTNTSGNTSTEDKEE